MSDHLPEIDILPAASGSFMALRDVGKSFAGKSGPVSAIADATLDIGLGETVALIGPSGCGKTTLLMLIAGLIAPSAGHIHISGQKLRGPRPDMAMVFQRDLLFDWRSVLDNVLVPFALRGEPTAPHIASARALLSHVGLEGCADRRPWQLSGGMRQRVALCRALIQNPDMLLLDEPFAALDALTREQMQLDVQRLSQDRRRTTILVTHDIAEAVFMADRVVVMTARPSRIRDILPIDLPRPRDGRTRALPEFADLVARLHSMFTSFGVLHG